jgi:hypothetical protein
LGDTKKYEILITDVRLQGALYGWDVARYVREKEPAFPVIYVTGSNQLWGMGVVSRSRQYPHFEAIRSRATDPRRFQSPQHRDITDNMMADNVPSFKLLGTMVSDGTITQNPRRDRDAALARKHNSLAQDNKTSRSDLP